LEQRYARLTSVHVVTAAVVLDAALTPGRAVPRKAPRRLSITRFTARPARRRAPVMLIA
jgi:hypothetical protein